MKLSCAILAMGVVIASAQTPPTFQSAMQQQQASIAVQREAVKKQAEMAAQWRGPLVSSPPPESSPPECDPMPAVDATPIIDAAAKAHHVQSKLLRSVIEQESSYRPCAVSVKGAKGMMQLMPATLDDLGVTEPFDAKQNIDAGARYLKQLVDRYKGDISLALAAFNAGPGKVDDAGGIPDIKETKDYVDAILKKVR